MDGTSEPLAVVAGIEIHRGVTVGNLVSIATTMLSAAVAAGSIIWTFASWAGGINVQQAMLMTSLGSLKENVSKEIGSIQATQRSNAAETQIEIQGLRNTVDQILLQRRGDAPVEKKDERNG